MLKITPIQERLLKQLAIYKFLTISQCETLKIGHKSKITEGLRELEEKGFVKYVQYAVTTSRKGKAKRIHFLTPKGAKILVESNHFLHLEEIRYPKSSNTIFKNDYFHRISTINTQISYHQWIKSHQVQPELFLRYFDKVGSMRNQDNTGLLHGATRLDFLDGSHIEPDGIIIYTTTTTNLFILEVFNGNDSQRVVEQIKKSSRAIIEGLASDRFQYEVPTRLLSTFEYESNMNAVMQRLQGEDDFQYEGIESFFFFGLAEKVWRDFDSWVDLNKKHISLSEQF